MAEMLAQQSQLSQLSQLLRQSNLTLMRVQEDTRVQRYFHDAHFSRLDLTSSSSSSIKDVEDEAERAKRRFQAAKTLILIRNPANSHPLRHSKRLYEMAGSLVQFPRNVNNSCYLHSLLWISFFENPFAPSCTFLDILSQPSNEASTVLCNLRQVRSSLLLLDESKTEIASDVATLRENVQTLVGGSNSWTTHQMDPLEWMEVVLGSHWKFSVESTDPIDSKVKQRVPIGVLAHSSVLTEIDLSKQESFQVQFEYKNDDQSTNFITLRSPCFFLQFHQSHRKISKKLDANTIQFSDDQIASKLTDFMTDAEFQQAINSAAKDLTEIPPIFQSSSSSSSLTTFEIGLWQCHGFLCFQSNHYWAVVRDPLTNTLWDVNDLKECPRKIDPDQFRWDQITAMYFVHKNAPQFFASP